MAVVLVSEPDRGIVTLTLDSPANRNALSAALVGELADALAESGRDDGVRAVVLTHTGSTFCAGADLREPPDPGAFVALLRQLVELPKPVVARVRGHVRAGGLGLLGACDIAVAGGPDVSFALTEVHIGVVPAVISLTLLPRLDARAASRYYLTGERFGGAEAARIGLVSAYAGADDGVGVVLEPVLEGLRKAAPGALADAKRLVTARVLDAFDKEADALVALSAHRFGSAEAKEGMEAFLERRERSWAL
ncbi:enoyl-CoA hydratase family protein [Streptomyces flavofungini]|uniref:Enoyl-CoA hydratase family protein n=1 Tax=Streptomyces flavofungini TaxID=68200 RepID=A0ABS0X154_9ACTN|nr:enoyl-CoA hydratase family protein [Streptomyces flavofungini]MBJ3806809.1 enoyl-CoA hydratase family protein [Streptomyces flavofungini]GHC60408.1 enoyl-CoA hydratase [Streptomyces flavofungini]